MAAMETLSNAITRLTGAGYTAHFYAEGGQLVCDQCGAPFEPSAVVVDEVVRFEGASDPGDQAILYALVGDGNHRGFYSVAYGVAATNDDIAVLLALPDRVH